MYRCTTLLPIRAEREMPLCVLCTKATVLTPSLSMLKYLYLTITAHKSFPNLHLSYSPSSSSVVEVKTGIVLEA